MWNKLVSETILYAVQERTKKPPPPFAAKWTPVTVSDLKTFVGLCFAMGIIRLPSKNDYWTQTKWLFSTSFGRVMPRDRFTQIWRYLHLQNNEDQLQQPDKLWKVCWFLSFLNSLPCIDAYIRPYFSCSYPQRRIFASIDKRTVSSKTCICGIGCHVCILEDVYLRLIFRC
jgi:hypothetical protein